MSIRAGRAYLVAVGALFLGCVAWFCIASAQSAVGSRPIQLAAPAAVGVIAAVALVSGVALLARFVEATISAGRSGSESGADAEGDRAVEIRSVLRPRRDIPLAGIDAVVVLDALVLPARSGSPVRRVVIRRLDGSVVAFTPHDVDFVRRLRAHGIAIDVDAEGLTPAQAAHRYPGSVGAGERWAGRLLWAAIVVPLVVIAWALWANAD